MVGQTARKNGSTRGYIIIIIIIKLQLVWHRVAVVQYIFTHKEHTEYRGRNTHNNYKKIQIFGSKLGIVLGNAGHAPSLRVIPWHLPYN
jgi:flagellar basal body-associated protein FliL